MSTDESACADTGVDCADAFDQLERYLDGELPHVTVEQMSAHLSQCYPCADRASFEEQLRSIVRQRCTEAVPSGLVDRIRARLDLAGAPGPAQ